MERLGAWARLARHWVWLMPLVVGIAFVAGGVYMIMEGRNAHDDVQENIAREDITVSDDAASFAGETVDSADEANAQADVILEHTLAATGGYLYAQMGQYYLPEGTGVDVLGYWAPERTTVANDFFVVPARSERPVLAHLFIDYLLDPANAQFNFEFVGYQPALTTPSPDELIAAELVPAHLVSALVSDAQVENGYRLDALAPDVQQLWENAFQRVKAG